LTGNKQLLSPGHALKEDVIDWMIKHTVEASSAVYMFQLAKTVTTYISRTIDKHWLEKKSKTWGCRWPSQEEIALSTIVMEPIVQHLLLSIVSNAVGCTSVYVQRQR
jgi:hypothetical protein